VPAPKQLKDLPRLRLVFLETPSGVVFHGGDQLEANAEPRLDEGIIHDAAIATALALVVAKARWLSAKEGSLAVFKLANGPAERLLVVETKTRGSWITTVWTGIDARTDISRVFDGATDGARVLVSTGGRSRRKRKDKSGNYAKPLKIGMDIKALPITKVEVVKATGDSGMTPIKTPGELIALVDAVVLSFATWKPVKIDLKTGKAQVRKAQSRTDANTPASTLRKNEPESVPGILHQQTELDVHQKVSGRDWLFRRVEEFIKKPANEEGDYFLLTARPFFGKSAIAAEIIRRTPRIAAYHFIKQGRGDWDKTDVLLRSLAAQILRRYAPSETEADRDRSAEGVFYDALLRVSRAVPSGEHVVLFVDGLDEAFGLARRSDNLALLTAFPKRLPARCKIIFTSREGEHLNSLRALSICRTLNTEEFREETNTDINEWLRQENTERGLHLEERFLSQLAEASDGLLGAAVWFLRPREGIAEELARWQRAIPYGLNGLLKLEWQRIVAGAQDVNISEADCRRLLGILATAREPLAWANIQALLLTAINNNPAAPFSIPGIGDAVQVFQPARLLEHGETILKLAKGYFWGQTTGSNEDRFVFFHESFPEYVREMLFTAAEGDFCNCLLAQGAADWRNKRLFAYAIHNRFEHLLNLRNWCEPFGRAFADTQFIEVFSEERGPEALCEMALTALGKIQRNRLTEWESEFKDLADFLWDRRALLEIEPECFGQDLLNEFVYCSSDVNPPLSRKLRAIFATLNETTGLVNSSFLLKKIKGSSTVTQFADQSKRTPATRPPDDARVFELIDHGNGKVRMQLYERPWTDIIDPPPSPANLPADLYFENLIAISPDDTFMAMGRAHEECVTVRRLNTVGANSLLFPRALASVSFTKTTPLCLVVADEFGDEWVYEVVADKSLEEKRAEFISFLRSLF